jgi:hypothetical protein
VGLRTISSASGSRRSSLLEAAATPSTHSTSRRHSTVRPPSRGLASLGPPEVTRRLRRPSVARLHREPIDPLPRDRCWGGTWDQRPISCGRGSIRRIVLTRSDWHGRRRLLLKRQPRRSTHSTSRRHSTVRLPSRGLARPGSALPLSRQLRLSTPQGRSSPSTSHLGRSTGTLSCSCRRSVLGWDVGSKTVSIASESVHSLDASRSLFKENIQSPSAGTTSSSSRGSVLGWEVGQKTISTASGSTRLPPSAAAATRVDASMVRRHSIDCLPSRGLARPGSALPSGHQPSIARIPRDPVILFQEIGTRVGRGKMDGLCLRWEDARLGRILALPALSDPTVPDPPSCRRSVLGWDVGQKVISCARGSDAFRRVAVVVLLQRAIHSRCPGPVILFQKIGSRVGRGIGKASLQSR